MKCYELNFDEFQENFYIEELEDRLEMSASPGGLLPNKICWGVVIPIP